MTCCVEREKLFSGTCVWVCVRDVGPEKHLEILLQRSEGNVCFFLWQFPTNDVFYLWGWCRELWDMFAVPLENKAGNWTDAQSMEIKPSRPGMRHGSRKSPFSVPS